MKKKFTIKKIVLLSILVLIIFAVGFVANAFIGNPISKALAKYEYKRYVEETYSNTDFKVIKASYNFKDMNYWADVISESKKLKFQLSKRHDGIIQDDYRDQPTLVDNETSFRFKEEIKSEIMKEVEVDNKIVSLKDIYVNLTFPQGKYDKDSKFTRDIDEEIKIQVNLSRENLKDKVLDKEIDNEEKVIVIDEEFIEEAYKIKEIIINMGYTGLTEIGLQFQDDNYNYEYISLDKEHLGIPKEELINFKAEYSSIYEKGGDEEVYLRLENDIKLTLHYVKNIEYIMVYDNKLGGSTGNTTAELKILKEVKPTKEELAKEVFEIKELIQKQHPEIKYLDMNFYEYGEINAKGGNWGQYYGSIFIGNEFAPWTVSQEEVNSKLKVWDKL